MENRNEVPEGSCAFFIDRKRRFCRFRPSVDQKYCAEHAGLLGIELEKKRIPCPLNPKHTCYESKLAKHLKKCRNRPGILPPYHCEGINSGENDMLEEVTTKVSFSEIPLNELQKLIDRINHLYEKYIKDVDCEILTHQCLNEELSNRTYGIQAIRHRKQQASLIGHLEKMGLLHEGLCYVEFGAGKGGLSHWIQTAQSEIDNLSFVLVDRSHVRYKLDNLHKWKETEPKFERLRIDIENLDLAGVESVTKGGKPVIAVGKHLCGCATDLALRCMVNGMGTNSLLSEQHQPPHKRSRQETEQKPSIKFGGLAIALCCHHRCTWKSYVGKQFFTQCGLRPSEFQLMCKLSGWATDNWKGWKSVSGMHKDLIEDSSTPLTKTSDIIASKNSDSPISSSDSAKQITDSCDSAGLTYANKTGAKVGSSDDVSEIRDDLQSEHETMVSWKRSDLKLSDEERGQIGWKCKRLIDFGRVQYLKENDLQTSLKIYINYKLTPENVAIFALPI